MLTTFKKLTSKILALAMVLMLIAPTVASVQAASGTIRISTNLLTGVFTLYDAWDNPVGGPTYVGMTPVDFDLPLGGYYVTFFRPTDDTNGIYTIPVTQFFNLTNPNQLIEFVGEYGAPLAPVYGTLSVSTNLINGAYNVYDAWDNVVGSGNGMTVHDFDLTAGGYYVEFLTAPLNSNTNYITPATAYINLSAGQTIPVYGEYGVTPTPVYGTLSVSTNLINGAYNIYDINDNVVGSGAGTTVHDFDLVAGGYYVEFLTAPLNSNTNYITPATAYINLASSQTEIVYGQYTLTTPTTGTLIVNTNMASGAYNVYDVNDNIVGSGAGTTPISFDLIPGAYSVEFLDTALGYLVPATAYLNIALSTTTNLTGIYTNTGTIQVNVEDQFGTPITDASYTLLSCTGATIPTCTTVVNAGTQSATFTETAGTYAIAVNLTGGYTSVVITSLNPQVLALGGVITFTVQYISPISASVEATTTPVIGEIFVDGISIGSPAAAGTYIPTTLDVTQSHTISFGAVGGYTTPANIVIPANTLAQGSTTQYTGNYVAIVSSNATLEIATTPVTGEVFVDNVSIGTAAASGTFLSTVVDRTLAHTISFGAVAGYTTPANIVIAASTLAGGSTNQYTGVYTAVAINTATIQVTTQPFAAEIFVNGVSIGTPAAAGTFLTTTVNITVPNAITFATVSGYQSPTIAIPANTLANGSTTQYTGTYTNDFTLTKTASVTAVGDNQVITYTIVLNRNTTAPGSITVRLIDTVTGTGVINGNNGGALNVILNTGTCTGVTCSNQQIDQSFIDVAMDDASSVATITYQVRSSNAGIPANGTSAAVNTVTATYGAITINDSETVTIQGPVSGGNGGGGGGSGGGSSSGSGGGHIQITGDMKLNIKKEVSINNENFKDASTQSKGLAIPEKKQTRLYTRLTLTNPGKVTATKIKLDPFFTQGDTDMFAGGIENVLGARLDSKTGQLVIDEIKAGKSATVSYSRMIDERGQNPNFAIDGVKLVKFGSRLPITQDGLKYLGIGETTASYLYAGQPQILKDFASAQSDIMALSLTASSAIAKVGDLVNFTLKATNISGSDLTGLYFTFDYDENGFDIAKAIGAKDDGRALSWKRLILRPNETATYNFSARVIGGTLLISTVRAMANEVENLPTLTHELQVSGAASGVRMRLVQTGALSTTLMILMLALAGLGYKSLERRRYSSLRAMALMPV